MKTVASKILLLNLLLIFSFTAYTQTNEQDSLKIDSLKKVLLIQKEDTNKVNTLRALYLASGDLDTAMQYAKQESFLSDRINFKKGKAFAYWEIAWIYDRQSNYEEAIKNGLLSLKLWEELNDKYGRASLYFQLHRSYGMQGNYPENLKNVYASLKLWEELGNQEMIALCLTNLGLIYSTHNNQPEAMKNTLTALKMYEKSGNKNRIATCYNIIGEIHFNNGNYSQALPNQLAALKLYGELAEQDRQRGGIASCYEDIGKIYEKQGELAYTAGDKEVAIKKYLEAQKNYLISLKEYQKVKYKDFVASSYVGLANISIKLKKYSEARDYLQKSLQLSKETGFKYATRDSYRSLSNLDSTLRNYDQAFTHYKMYILYRDSILDQESAKKSLMYKMQYESEKKDAAAQAEQEKKEALAAAELKNQKIIRNFSLSGVVGVIFFAGYSFYRYRRKKALQHQQSLMKERLRISRELHDEVGATLSGIAMYSHLTKEQIKQSDTTEVEKSLNIMQQSAGEMVDKLNDIVWLINPDQDSLQKLIQRLEEYARDMAAIKNMQVKVNVPEHLHEHSLPMESRRNIYLFCKEAINNAVKYSNGTLLELNIKEVENKLEFSVSDNGKGFDAVMVRRGNGLENMQKRADEIGAKLMLQSKKDEGSLVSMQIKIT